MRVGLEVELLAPEGSSRLTLARAFAREVGGRVRSGFKYHGAGFLPDGRPDCRLSDAWKVERDGAWLASFVDDPTIVDDLRTDERQGPLGRTDDVRLALWIERECWGATKQSRATPLVKTFAARDVGGLFVEPLGHPLLGWTEESTERQRVCEVVLAPLGRKELKKTLGQLCRLARALGFLVPAEGAIHAHYDAEPFRSTRALRRLILEWTKRRPSLVRQLEPNPRCRKLGPFSDQVLQVARASDDDTPFATVAAGLALADLHRAVDLNLLGLVERFPKQPTVELRCLPSTLDADATLARLKVADAFFTGVLA